MTALQAREAEFNAYSANVAVYQALLARLDGDWDADLIHLKDIEGQEAARQCPMDRLERLAVLQQYEQVTNLLKTEIVERAKSLTILETMRLAQE